METHYVVRYLALKFSSYMQQYWGGSTVYAMLLRRIFNTTLRLPHLNFINLSALDGTAIRQCFMTEVDCRKLPAPALAIK